MRGYFLITCFLLACVSITAHEQDQETTRMKRTSCFIITKNYVGTIQDQIITLLQGVQEQDRRGYISKLYAAMGQQCEDNISQSQMQQFYVDSGSDLEIQNYFYLFESLDLVEILADDWLNPRQTDIADFQIHLQGQFRKRENESEGRDDGF